MDLSYIFRTKYLIVSMSIGVVLLLLYIVWRVVFFGTATIYIEGPHDPLTTRVAVNSSGLLPSGVEGRAYKFQHRIGNAIVEVTGPQIKNQRVEMDIQSFSEASETITVESLSAIELAISIVEPGVADEISSSKFFGYDNSWLVVELSRPGIGDGRYFYVYSYNSSGAQWSLLAEGIKIDLANKTNRELPEELISYLEIMAGD